MTGLVEDRLARASWAAVEGRAASANRPPSIGPTERARQFERWLTSVHARDPLAVEPVLRRLDAPTLIVWGTGDRFFDVGWAHWLAHTLPT